MRDIGAYPFSYIVEAELKEEGIIPHDPNDPIYWSDKSMSDCSDDWNNELEKSKVEKIDDNPEPRITKIP